MARKAAMGQSQGFYTKTLWGWGVWRGASVYVIQAMTFERSDLFLDSPYRL